MEALNWDVATEPRQDDWYEMMIPPLNLAEWVLLSTAARTLYAPTSSSFEYERALEACIMMIDSEQNWGKSHLSCCASESRALQSVLISEDQRIIGLLISNSELIITPE